ncbi:MAG: TonB-dependent receptor [Bacteroidales bacterium]
MARIALIFYSLLFSLSLSAQVVRLSAKAKPLNQLLVEMRDRYGLRFSFDDQELSQFKITVRQEFTSPQKALDYLLKPISYTYIQNQGVFVVYPLPPKPVDIGITRQRKDLQLSGTIYDRNTGETLPYTYIEVNKTLVASDENGCFNYNSKTDSTYRLTFRHLGYFIKDTVVVAGTSFKFYLRPSNYLINEVVVSSLVEKSMHLYELPGSIRANNLVAKNIPGNEGGSVFSLLRLLPGVYSAGEQNRDLVIWGGYEGQSEVTFDGFTLFGLKNFNDNISVVNPYMVRDVKVFKGGFGAKYDDKVGGIVNVTGVEGNLRKPELKANISNLTLNTMASVPIKKQASLVLAYRQTFYNLYEDQALTQVAPTNTNDHQTPTPEYFITPNYKFFDSNVKFSGKTDTGSSYYLSLYGGKDRFAYSVSNDLLQNPIRTEATQLHTQLGASGEFSQQWQSGNRTTLRFSYSGLDATGNDFSSSNNRQNRLITTDRENYIHEYKLIAENQLVSNSKHAIQFGGGVVGDNTAYSQKSTQPVSSSSEFPLNNASQVYNAYISDRISVSPQISFSPGLRVDMPLFNSKIYWQPRLSGEWALDESFKIGASWGMYNQFNAKLFYIEQYTARPTRHESNQNILPPDQYQQIWTSADGKKVPIVNSNHSVLGLYYQSGGFSASTEAFWKKTDGLSRWERTFSGNNTSIFKDDVFFGLSRAFGLDFMIKQQYRRHYAWVSYSYGKTEEHFTNQYAYQSAPQDQRHELKGALLLDFSPLSLSSSYVYGSGFPSYSGLTLLSETNRKDYNRLDVSLCYRFSPRYFKMQGGVSILNLLNSKNLIFSNLVNASSVSSDVFAVYSQAIPFTPMVFFEFSF